MTSQNLIQLGIVGAAHGIKGEVRVKTFTGDAMALGDYGPLQTASGRVLEVAQLRPSKEVVVVRFKGVDTRNDAEALNGTELFVDRSRLSDDLEDDEFYHVDLIGLAVETLASEPIGTITAVHDFGAGEMLDVKRKGAKPVLIPFTRAAVPDVDLKARLVRVDPEAAGLVDDGEDAPIDDEEGSS